MASAASGITRPRDLAGRKVSVNSLGAAGDVTIMAAVEADGGDPATIQFVEVAFPDVPAQLEAGTIDAGWVPEPFVTQLTSRGDTLVVAPYQATIPGLATLTTITRLAALSVPGVGRMAPVSGGVNRLLRRGPNDGVQIEVQNNTVFVDLFLILKQDVNIREVSRNVQQQVARSIQEMVGMEVGHIDIHIEDIDYEEAPEA